MPENIDITGLMQHWPYRTLGWTPVKRVFRVETSAGTKCLKPITNSPKKVAFICSALQHLQQTGFQLMPHLEPTRTGQLFLSISPDCHFILTPWIEGYRPDYNNQQDLAACSTTLAIFHKASWTFTPQPHHKPVRNRLGRWTRRLQRRLQELQVYQQQPRGKVVVKDKADAEFISLFYQQSQWICARAYTACQRLVTSGYEQLVAKANKSYPLTHGDVATRNFVITSDQQAYLIDFDFIAIDLPVIDLWRLLRRTLLRNWSMARARVILSSYSSMRPLSIEEYQTLWALLTFPHKHWEIIHKFYEGRVDAARAIAKLRSYMEQNHNIDTFLTRFHDTYIAAYPAFTPTFSSPAGATVFLRTGR